MKGKIHKSRKRKKKSDQRRHISAYLKDWAFKIFVSIVKEVLKLCGPYIKSRDYSAIRDTTYDESIEYFIQQFNALFLEMKSFQSLDDKMYI
jgi:hypothetical protein